MLKNAIIFAAVAVALAVYGPDLMKTAVAPQPPAETRAAAQVERIQAATPATQVAAAEASNMHGEKVIAPDANGQYEVDALIGGEMVHMLVDTGATFVSVPAELADRLGLDTSGRKLRMQTANGVNIATETTLPSVDLGTIYVRDVKAVIAPRGVPPVILLGESFLQRLSHVEQRGGMLVLQQ